MYWEHVGLHFGPSWLQALHIRHHKEFQLDRKLHLNLIEFLIEIPPGFAFSWWLTGSLPFAFLVVLVGLYEASRGHGQYKKASKVSPPKGYYRYLNFCGGRYHTYHHDFDPTKNLGQMLRNLDEIFGTEAVNPYITR